MAESRDKQSNEQRKGQETRQRTAKGGDAADASAATSDAPARGHEAFCEAMDEYVRAVSEAHAEAQRRLTDAVQTLSRRQRDPHLEADKRVTDAYQKMVSAANEASGRDDAQQTSANAWNEYTREQQDAWMDLQQAWSEAARDHAGQVQTVEEERRAALEDAYRGFVRAQKAAFAALGDDADPCLLETVAHGMLSVASMAASAGVGLRR